MSDPDHPTLAINQNLHRLPLILDILDEIETGNSHPGDDHLREGSHQAVRCMVERLQMIKPNQPSLGKTPPSTEMKMAATWLLGERPRKLLPHSLYQELSELVRRLLPENPEIMSGQTE
jgi:hypothetical protein